MLLAVNFLRALVVASLTDELHTTYVLLWYFIIVHVLNEFKSNTCFRTDVRGFIKTVLHYLRTKAGVF